MKEVKKTPAKKVAPKAVAAQKPVVAAKKSAPAPKKPAITPEQRYKMIEEAAYYIAERHGFSGDSQYFWSLAVAEIDAKLK